MRFYEMKDMTRICGGTFLSSRMARLTERRMIGRLRIHVPLSDLLIARRTKFNRFPLSLEK